ncbi:MAG TPA: ABC transporter permease [Candidatus Acidoferrales bacterium]|nr:ABC transporter permease [Candidatus Acidoferrales bacterium]
MTWLSRLLRKGKQDAQLDSELRFHVEQQTADNIAAGMSPEEARRRTLAQFGGLESRKEEAREARGTQFFDSLIQDIRFAFRILRKTPVVTAIALLSLALGIGANTAIFSLIDAVMLRMLPVQNPEQLAQITFLSPTSSRPRASVTNPIWEQVRDHQDAFSGVFAWSPEMFDLAEGGEVNNINGIYASGDYFDVLGVHPAAGRLLTASDDVRNCPGVAILGYGFWQSHYGGAQSAIGSSIRLNGHYFPIVGVAQRGFFGTDVGENLDVVIPICAEATLAGKDSALDIRDDWWLMMMGRLKPGVTVEQAEARMKVLSQPLFSAVVPQDWPAKDQDRFRKFTFGILPGATGTAGRYGLRIQYSAPLKILMFVVGLVLLIACANIASLLLARSAARQKEIAVRLSLGASRARLIRQVLTESIVLSAAGAILGVLFARWGSALLVRFVSTQKNQVFLDLKMDGRVLAFTIGIAVLCGLLFGILPALRGTRIDAISAMKEGQSQSSGGRSHSSAARWIVAAQVALSLILVVEAGIFIRIFANLMTVDAGFDRNNVLMVEANIHNAGIAEPARAPLYGQMLAKLQALPGVVSASQCWMTPLSGGQWDNNVTIAGHPLPSGVDPDTLLNWVTPGYFETMRTPLLEGRMFDARDTATSTPVVIVNQLLARRYFGAQSAIGEHLTGGSQGMLRQPMEIIGVVQNAKYTSLQEVFQPEAYFPLSQIKGVGEGTAFEIRTAIRPSSLIPAVRDTMASVNNLASLQFTTLKQKADDSVAMEHLMAVLSGFFGGLALLLTAIGLYGVMAYVVTQRTHEIGIRIALGAQHSSILRLVLRDALIVLAAGIAAGLGVTWIMRLVMQALYGIKSQDVWAISLAVVVMACVALVATYIPARRAMKVDPMVALRYE